MPKASRKDKIRVDADLLRRLYAECDGWIQRIHEKLNEEEKIPVTYPTLVRLVRELGLGRPLDDRCERVADKPGVEMQHDTSPYVVKFAGRAVRVIASMVYMRFSKRRYLRFYRVFNRFMMKCFLHEALRFWGYAAKDCIIDNTNLARLRGSGKNAVIVPEMATFSKQYRYEFHCHAIKHANRKAGEERSFWTVETNFFPGRKFQGMEDMNDQAFDWSSVRMDNKPQGKAKLIPIERFEHEIPYLRKLPPYVPEPYLELPRGTDQYGFAAFDTNFYWVPGTKREDVLVIRYMDRLKIYQARECLVEYRLPPDGVRNQCFSPEGCPPPRYRPRNRKKPTQEEEKRLLALGEPVKAYLDFLLKPGGNQRHRMIRDLFTLSRKMSDSLFVRAVERALRYRITSMETLRNIAVLQMSQGELDLPCVDVDESFREREAYREGRLTDTPDFTPYDKMLEDDDG